MPRCFPARRRIGLKRRRQLSVMLLAVLPVIAATSPPPDSVFDTGLGAAQVASDSELADMRGKFISAENVRFFGITLHTLWQSDDGVVTAASLGFSIWLGENGASGPQVDVQWQREGDPDMDVAGFAPGADGAYVVAPTTGAFQSNVIAGSDNQTANRMSVAVVPATSVATGSSGGTFTGTATGTALDGDTITFIAEDGQFGLAMVDAQGLPIRLILSEGQAYDGHSAHLMLDSLTPGSILLADRAYDADKLRAAIAGKGAFANIPPMPQRVRRSAFSPFLYR